jgi:hypothetical protein
VSDAPIPLPTDLGRLGENLLDLELALADAYREPDRDDPRAAAWLDDLIRQHAAHVAALARYELREVARG